MDLDAEGLLALASSAALPAGFGGRVFDLQGTIAVSTTGSPAGNDVYVTDLNSGLTSVVPMLQAEDDPGSVRYLAPDTVLVPARRSGLVYGLALSDLDLAPLTGDVAQSPEEAIPLGARLYVVDSNLDRATGEPLGPSRVIVLDRGTGGASDTVPLGGVRAFRAGLVGSKLVVLEAGPADSAGGRLAVIDVTAEPLVLSRELELQAVGVSLEVGLDGRVYVAAAPDPAVPGSTVVLVVDPVAEGFVAGPEAPLGLVRLDGSDASCRAATASADGSVFCIEDRGIERGLLYTYEPDLTGKTQITLDALPTDLVVLDFP